MPNANINRIVRIVVFAALGIIIFSVVATQSVNLIMNVSEFGQVFTKPLYYAVMSGMILSAIIFVRVNFRARHSTIWYGIKVLINFLRKGEFEQKNKIPSYFEFRMGKLGFALWQVTKVVLFAPLFANIIFGMAVEYMVTGNDVGLDSISSIFAVPFIDIPSDMSFSQQNIVPAIPALILVIPPLLTAVGLRLLIYVGISGATNIVSQYVLDSRESKPKFLSYISKMEIIAGAAILWVGFNLFFSSSIDYNTRYTITGTLTLGAALIGYGIVDKRHAKVMIYPNKKHMYSRLFTAAIIVGLTGSIVIVNDSLASTNKELSSPYIVQHIAINRHIHDIEDITTVNYEPQVNIAPAAIQKTVNQNNDALDNIRLWDESNAKSTLQQELAQRNDLVYSDFDLLRFNDSMYWTGATAPVVPPTLPQDNRWFSQHMKYTHSDVGMKMIDARSGEVVNESQFFSQRRVYYGEEGQGTSFSSWSAFPKDRQESNELEGIFYNGTGGVDISPPLSWIFEPNFMISDPGNTIHVMRYKDVTERMELLYPYFVYEFGFGTTPNNPQLEQVESYLVSDGKNTYWLTPLIAAINTSNVPFSSTTSSSFMLEFVGFSLTDAYNGSIQIIVTGNGAYSKMFSSSYANTGLITPMPAWLENQVRYPEEMFIWQISKFNVYHVTDPEAYMEMDEVYAVADTSDEFSPLFTNAKPTGFNNIEFVGVQPLKLKQQDSANILGYIVVQNDMENLGKMTFYSTSNSETKLINSETAKTRLSKEYDLVKSELGKTSLVPRGKTLYKIGDYDVYFIPMFTDATGKQLGLVGAVGAASTLNAYVGFGNSAQEAFGDYLQKLSGAPPNPQGNQTTPEQASKIQSIERVFREAGLTVVNPTALYPHVEFLETEVIYSSDNDLPGVYSAIQDFIQEFAPPETQIYEWQTGNSVNFAILRETNGIVESHYISIEVT